LKTNTKHKFLLGEFVALSDWMVVNDDDNGVGVERSGLAYFGPYPAIP